MRNLVSTTLEKSCPLGPQLATEELDKRRHGGVGSLKKSTHVATEPWLRLESTLRCGQLIGLMPD